MLRRFLQQAFFCAILLASADANALTIYVSPTGSDRGSGSEAEPVASVNAALRVARNLRRLGKVSSAEAVHIQVQSGLYPLKEPVFVRPEDGGTANSPTIVEAAPGAHPVLSGGVAINGWQMAQHVSGLPEEAQRKVWVADAPVVGGNILLFRQLWVNGQKAIRARESNTDDIMSRIISVDKKKQEMWIPAPGVNLPKNGSGMELVIHQMWAIANLRIRTIDVIGNKARVTFQQPESRIQFEHPWPEAVIDEGHKQNGNSAFYLTNAIEFLDRPGEWYEDVKAGKVYYWPHEGEDLNKISVVAPALEKLVQVMGAIDRPVSYVSFKGIRFAYSTWLRPSQQGHVPLQAGMYLLDAYKLKEPGVGDRKGLENQAWIGRPPGAVEVSFANHTGFERCTFTHLASSGLDYIRGTHDDEVRGCLFSDIGGTGIQVGVYADEGVETHLNYNPADERDICTGEHIVDNLVTDVTNEDWGCVGISAGFVRDINIEHNEVRDVSYSGICVGWGWLKAVNCMRNNRMYANYVHHYAKHMYDVGGLYTLSAQPGSVISENCIDSIYHPSYVHDPHHWFYFYLDEGSGYINIHDNWCPEEKVMRNANGPGNTWENNGPNVSEKIKRAAGLEPEYKVWFRTAFGE